ncbi:hypothetical protein MNV49_006256 [Pseudohyphozyma bogoriensis]|nr:hypothetical protein MNV49_006256 [Pseudohyphozyma bogoriensis]
MQTATDYATSAYNTVSATVSDMLGGKPVVGEEGDLTDGLKSSNETPTGTTTASGPTTSLSVSSHSSNIKESFPDVYWAASSSIQSTQDAALPKSALLNKEKPLDALGEGGPTGGEGAATAPTLAVYAGGEDRGAGVLGVDSSASNPKISDPEQPAGIVEGGSKKEPNPSHDFIKEKEIAPEATSALNTGTASSHPSKVDPSPDHYTTNAHQSSATKDMPGQGPEGAALAAKHREEHSGGKEYDSKHPGSFSVPDDDSKASDKSSEHHKASLGDKAKGTMEKLVGKVTKNEAKVEHGEALKKGEL